MLRRAVSSFLLAVLTAVGAATEETEGPWIRGVYTGESPRPVAVTEAEGWFRASKIAGDTPKSFVLMGTGRSMQPLYEPGTILVLRQLSYAELKRGQTVLYRNKANKVVAHVLVARARDGWRVRGLNNPLHDMEPVHAGNLVGVVMAAFGPTRPPHAMTVAGVRRAQPPGLN